MHIWGDFNKVVQYARPVATKTTTDMRICEDLNKVVQYEQGWSQPRKPQICIFSIILTRSLARDLCNQETRVSLLQPHSLARQERASFCCSLHRIRIQDSYLMSSSLHSRFFQQLGVLLRRYLSLAVSYIDDSLSLTFSWKCFEQSPFRCFY